MNYASRSYIPVFQTVFMYDRYCVFWSWFGRYCCNGISWEQAFGKIVLESIRYLFMPAM